MDKLTSLLNRAVSRRKFVAGVGATAGATVVLGLNGCSGSGPTPTPTPTPTPIAFTDADVLNFALNLEYLEAQFYLYAATGSGLEASDLTPGSASKYQTVGTVTLGDAAAVPGLTPEQQDILNEIAYEEQEHVRFLRTALGSAAVPMPDIDLSFFGPLAVAAGITQNATGAGSFNPFDSFDDFLVGGFIFEDVGVTAYSGAAGLISPARRYRRLSHGSSGHPGDRGLSRRLHPDPRLPDGPLQRVRETTPHRGRSQHGRGPARDAHSWQQRSSFDRRFG